MRTLMATWDLVKAQSGLPQEVEGGPHHSTPASGNHVLSQSAEESIQRDPHMGSHGVVKLEGCPQVSKVSSPSLLLWKKSNFVFIGVRNKANVCRFCAPGPRRL